MKKVNSKAVLSKTLTALLKDLEEKAMTHG